MNGPKATAPEVPARAANSETDRQAMEGVVRASHAARDAERALEEGRNVAAQVQRDAAEKVGQVSVYKADQK